MKQINENKLMLFIVIVVILLVVMFFFISTLFGGAKRVAVNYAKGMSNFDSQLIADLYAEEMFKESYQSKEEVIKELDVMFESMRSTGIQVIRYKLAKNFKVYESEELEEQKKQLIEYYEIESKHISEIRRYDVSFYCVYESEFKEVEIKLNIAKIKNKWYLIGTE